MTARSFLRELLPSIISYRLARWGLLPAPRPTTLTFSVTNICQSRCKTCRIWELYREHPDRVGEELTLDEIERTFRGLGHVYFFNISGGEPYLRKDLPEIIGLACDHLTPGVIHIPTNCIALGRLKAMTPKIMEIIAERGRSIPFTIKPSFDGVGEKHDEIRGVKGNFARVLEAVAWLKELQQEYPNLHIGLGTVISQYNINDLQETAEYAESLNVDSYINEIAEQRSEMFNVTDPITPSADDYARAMESFKQKTAQEVHSKRHLSRITQAFRLFYYDLVVAILRENKQVIPCYAGLSNAHISPYGDVWPCCVLAYDQSMGNLRDADYDFWKVWRSDRARQVREYIKEGKCACPLANQAYSNLLCDFGYLRRVGATIFRGGTQQDVAPEEAT